jgi:hypothetical protein
MKEFSRTEEAIFPNPRRNPEADAWYVPVASNKAEGSMKKHQTITGFVAVVLLVAAATATAATMRSAPSAHPVIAMAGIMSLKELAVDVNKLAVEEFDDQSLVYSTGHRQ